MRTRWMVPVLALAAAVPAAAQHATLCPMPAHADSFQSPVNITGAAGVSLRPLYTHYPRVRGEAYNTGHNVKVNVAAGDSITVDGVRFGLEEFHFHWPGEHRLAGDTFPAEIHMVHKDAAGRAVVLGTWVRYGPRNRAWDELWSRLPTGSARVPITVDLPAMFVISDLNRERVFRYCGSLTTGSTEPYAAGITWLMRRTPITMTHQQLDRLRQVMGRYSRDVQPRYGRPIRYRTAGH